MHKNLFIVTLISILFTISFTDTATAAGFAQLTDSNKELATNYDIKKETSTYSQTKKVKLADMLMSDTKNIVKYGEYIYYINKNENNSIYRMKNDKSENTSITNLIGCENLSLVGNNIYFTSEINKNKFLYKVTIDNSQITKILDVKKYKEIHIYKDLIYYIGEDKLLHNVDLNGEGDKTISKDPIYKFWIYEDFIYCQIESSKNAQIENTVLYKLNVDSGKISEFLKGNEVNNFFYDDVKFIDGYVYLVNLANSNSSKTSVIYDKYCYRAKLSDANNIEKLDLEDTSIDVYVDKNTLYNSYYNKLYCIEKDGVKELQAKLPKNKIIDVDDNYIYFMDYGENICRVKKDGTNEEKISIPDKSIYGDVNTSTEVDENQISGDYIYYNRKGFKPTSDGKFQLVDNLCKVKKDGTQDIILPEGDTTGFSPEIIYKNKSYGLEYGSPYFKIIETTEGTDNNYNIIADDCSTGIKIHVVDGWIYYFSDNTLKRVKTDGSQKEIVIVFKKSGSELTSNCYFYGDYFYNVDSNEKGALQFLRKDLKNNGAYENFMPLSGLNFKAVDDKYAYFVDMVGGMGKYKYEIHKSDLNTKTSALVYTSPDIDNFKSIGMMNGKFYFTRTIHEVKSLE